MRPINYRYSILYSKKGLGEKQETGIWGVVGKKDETDKYHILEFTFHFTGRPPHQRACFA